MITECGGTVTFLRASCEILASMPERTAAVAVPTTKPEVRVLHKAGTHDQLVLGIASDGERIVAVGGQGIDLLLISTNNGKSFKATSSGGSGLRAAMIRGDSIHVVGEWGHTAYSRDFGKTWKTVKVKSGPCLFGIVADDRGWLWTAGDGGYIAWSEDGTKWTRAKGIRDYIGRISNSALGVLVPTDNPGNLYVREGRGFRKTSAESGADLMAARVTPAGTLVAVGAGGAVLRSTDRGERFERIKVATKGLIAGLEVFADGRLVVVGDKGVILLSTDDGKTLTKLPHAHTTGQLWCATRHGASVLVGGEAGLVLELA